MIGKLKTPRIILKWLRAFFTCNRWSMIFLSRWDRRFLSDWLRSSFDLIFLGYLYPVVDKVWTRKCVVLSGRIPPRLLAVFIVVSKVCLRLVLCFVSVVQVWRRTRAWCCMQIIQWHSLRRLVMFDSFGELYCLPRSLNSSARHQVKRQDKACLKSSLEVHTATDGINKLAENRPTFNVNW